MIEGVVNADHEAVITLSLSHPTGRMLEVEAVIDTGYNGFLTLPAELVADMALPFVGPSRATLANGAVETFDVHEATILWDGKSRDIEADATGGIPLVGMLLLDGHDLSVQVRVGGRVQIEAQT